MKRRIPVKSLLAVGFYCLLAHAAQGATPVSAPSKLIAQFHNFVSQKDTQGWKTQAARPEIAPRFGVDARGGRKGGGALFIATDNNAALGSWQRTIQGIKAGQNYYFVSYYRTKNVRHERRSITARLEWQDGNGRQVSPPVFALDAGKDGVWTKVEYFTIAPEKAHRLVIDLSFGWNENGQVWWDDIELREETAPVGRTVRALTVFHRPANTKSAAESVEQFCTLIERSVTQKSDNKPDIICLPEGITLIGNGKTFPEIGEPIPGPTTKRLGALAQKLNSYIVAGIYERVGSVIYNSAVLIGRKGEVVGTYRKTHLPREEVEGGLTPGNSYPVFQTDFGKVGLLVCWDVQFPEPARAMALQGAEVILLPIWGGSEVLAQARAIENHVFLISSSYDMKTFIVDPAGKVLAEATKEKPLAFAELNLDKKIMQPWIGDMKTRTWKERRPDIPAW
jgi:predicted amidohydrolase